MPKNLTALGNKVSTYTGLETFQKPDFSETVTIKSDEVTAVCPITNQPDWYTVAVKYTPNHVCIESKTFKLLMHSLREKGMFCEALASYILSEVIKYADPLEAWCTVTQKPRGGVEITATSYLSAE